MKSHSSSAITSVTIAASIICVSFVDSSGITLQTFEQNELSNNTLAQMRTAEQELRAGNEVAADSTWIDGKLAEFNLVSEVDPWKS